MFPFWWPHEEPAEEEERPDERDKEPYKKKGYVEFNKTLNLIVADYPKTDGPADKVRQD